MAQQFRWPDFRSSTPVAQCFCAGMSSPSAFSSRMPHAFAQRTCLHRGEAPAGEPERSRWFPDHTALRSSLSVVPFLGGGAADPGLTVPNPGSGREVSGQFRRPRPVSAPDRHPQPHSAHSNPQKNFSENFVAGFLCPESPFYRISCSKQRKIPDFSLFCLQKVANLVNSGL